MVNGTTARQVRQEYFSAVGTESLSTSSHSDKLWVNLEDVIGTTGSLVFGNLVVTELDLHRDGGKNRFAQRQNGG